MTNFKLLTSDEIVALCKSFMAEKRKQDQLPDPDHEGWNSELKLTPRMVGDILAANNEI